MGRSHGAYDQIPDKLSNHRSSICCVVSHKGLLLPKSRVPCMRCSSTFLYHLCTVTTVSLTALQESNITLSHALQLQISPSSSLHSEFWLRSLQVHPLPWELPPSSQAAVCHGSGESSRFAFASAHQTCLKRNVQLRQGPIHYHWRIRKKDDHLGRVART